MFFTAIAISASEKSVFIFAFSRYYRTCTSLIFSISVTLRNRYIAFWLLVAIMFVHSIDRFLVSGCHHRSLADGFWLPSSLFGGW
jgi:hypothetical protein